MGMNTEFTLTQKRALAIFTLVALLFGAYFLRNYFVLIVVAAVGAYLFTPLFNWFNKRLGTGLSATCTLLSALVIVIVPLVLLVLLAIVQISRMVEGIAAWVKTTDPSGLGDRVLHAVNDVLARIPFSHMTITAETLRKAMVTVGRSAGEWLLHFLQGALGGLAGAVTSAIIFLYVFVALLVNREKVRTLIGHLNPLGEEVTDLYLKKAGAMVRGTVSGQFVIALCQGVGRRRERLRRGISSRLLHLRDSADRAVDHSARRRDRDDPVRYRNDLLRQHRRWRVRRALASRGRHQHR